jgi:hypothetical protein
MLISVFDDDAYMHRQDSYFFYLFGVSEDSWYGALDITTVRSYLQL